MSELADGALSLEEGATPPVVEQTAQQPPQTENTAPPPTQATDDAEPDGTVVNPGGEKLVPLSALAAARQAAREAKAEVATLKPKAEKVDQIVSEWQAAQPILERAKQIASQPPPPQHQPPAPKGPLSDQEALEYAKDLDLYKADGTPDTDRAQRLASRQQSIAEKQAQQYVAPLVQQSAQGQSRANFEQAASFKADNGIQADRAILQQIWNNVPAEMSAQPHIARVLWSQAVTESLLQGKIKIGNAPPPPPAHTESLGGTTPQAQPLTSQSHALRQAADMSEKSFTALREKYQPGRPNALE